MTILFATFLYWLRLVRLPIHIRLKQRYVGSSAMFIIGFGLVELWGRLNGYGVAAQGRQPNRYG